uniref:hypothetical protein n=1 Tax=Phenylobacterium sp. TaxID=1871053 RepID=UPI0030F3E445
MSLKTLSIGALVRAMASTAVIGSVTLGAGFAVAAAPTPSEINAMKATIEGTISQTISDVLAANPNATEDEVAEAVALAVANVTRNVDPALAVAAINAVKADTTFMASLPSSIASAGADIALSAVRTQTQTAMNSNSSSTGQTGQSGETTGDIGGSGDGGSSGFGGAGGGAG